MPNIKSAKKRVRTNGRKAVVNTYINSSLKTAVKDFEASCKAGNKEEAAKNLNVALQRIDKANDSKLVKDNKASRLKSRLTKMKNAM
jgi:small subunit ribosomal protein S20